MTMTHTRKFWLVFYEGKYLPSLITNSLALWLAKKNRNYLGYKEIEINMEELEK